MDGPLSPVASAEAAGGPTEPPGGLTQLIDAADTAELQAKVQQAGRTDRSSGAIDAFFIGRRRSRPSSRSRRSCRSRRKTAPPRFCGVWLPLGQDSANPPPRLSQASTRSCGRSTRRWRGAEEAAGGEAASLHTARRREQENEEAYEAGGLSSQPLQPSQSQQSSLGAEADAAGAYAEGEEEEEAAEEEALDTARL